MTHPNRPADAAARAREFAARIAPFKGARRGAAFAQLTGNLLGLGLGYGLLFAAIERSVWWALPPLWVLTAVAATRLFLVQHDCGHGSFWPSRRANTLTGWLCSVVTFTPYGFWRYTHNRHHATVGHLDRGGVGDVFTASVAQFNAMSALDRRRYRRFRHPVMMMVVGVPLVFLLRYRTPFFQRVPPARCWRSIVGLDLALIAVYGGLAVAFGLGAVLLAVLPTVVLTAWVGGWMFFVQHQFEHGLWAPEAEWDWYEASLYGSSYYALPPLLHWCTGNVGLHHIHHLSSAIPNYRLRACLDAVPELADINRLTLRESFACARLALWDEAGRRMVSFAEAERAGLIEPA